MAILFKLSDFAQIGYQKSPSVFQYYLLSQEDDAATPELVLKHLVSDVPGNSHC